jgi:hypothetical protein
MQMKMKTLTQLFVLSALMTLMLSSCSKTYYECEPVIEEDSRWPWDITAEWGQESVEFDFKITATKNQTAAVLENPSVDSVMVTTSTGSNFLHYLFVIRNESNTTLFMTNQSVFDVENEDYPKYQSFMFLTEPLDNVIATYMIKNSVNDSLTYEGVISNYNYNEEEYSISITNGIMFNSDSTDSVTIHGDLDMESTPLIANSATSVPVSFSQTTTNIVLNPSGEYGRNTIELIDDTEFETIAEGSWEVTDTTAHILTIIETDDFGETDTLIIQYSLESDTLTFSQFKDPCNDYTDEAECFEQFELNFGLDENSITELSLTSTMTFTKSTSGKRRQIAGSHPAYWFGKTNYFRELYLK